MRRAHRHSSGHGMGGVMSSISATVVSAVDLGDAEAQKVSSADHSGGNDTSNCNDAGKQVTVLERLWRPVECVLTDICYTIEDRFIIPQIITAVPALIEEEFTDRQGFLMLVGYFISILTLMVFAAYSRRLSNLMSGASPVMGEIMFCVSHLSQVTQEQLGWSLFSSGFLSPSTFEWTATEGGVSGGVAILSGAGSQGSRRQMLGANGGGGLGANGASAGGSQGSIGVGGGSAGGIAGCPYTGGNLVRYLLGRKSNNMIRQELLRSYLYSSFYSPSAFLVEQTVWFVVLAATMDLVSMQRLAVAAFFANVVGWLPVYSVKPLTGLGVTLVVVFMYWIPSSEVDDVLLSVTFLHRPMHRVLSAYCASLCITLLFAETLLLDDVRRVVVHAVFTLPQRLLRVGGHHPVVTKVVHGCMWLRCEYFYFVDFYFFLGMMCWLSLVLMETAAGISVFGTAALLIAVPWLVGSGWRETPKQAFKDTIIYIVFYVVVALLLAHVVPWSGLAFLSNAVQSGTVLYLMAARCEYKQPGGSAYVLLWMAMMCVYLYVKAGTMRGTTGSLTWDLYDSNPRANFVKAAYAVWCGKPEMESGALSLLRIACVTFWQLLSKGLSEDGIQLLHFNVAVLGSMLLFSTTMRAVVVEGVRFSSPGPAVWTSAEATNTPAAASAASTVSPLPTSTTAASTKGDHNGGAAEAFTGRQYCFRGVLNGSHCSAPTSSSCAKSRVVPHVGGAKASSSSTASTMRRSWQAPTQASVAVIDACVSGNSSDGVAAPGEGRSEKAVTEALVGMEKEIEEAKEPAREVGSVAQAADEQPASPTPPTATSLSSVEDEGTPVALEEETEMPATLQSSTSSASVSKREDNQKEQRSQPSTASLTQIPTSVDSVDETVREEDERTPPQPVSDPDGKKTEAAALVSPRDESDIDQDASRSAYLEEIVNCNATSFTSTMCRSDMSSATLSSFHYDQAALLTSRSSTAAETPLEPRRERQEREHEKDRRHERERVKTPASTGTGASTTPFPAIKAEQEGGHPPPPPQQQLPQQRASKPSGGRKKSTDTETPTAASSVPALPLPRSRAENLKKGAEAPMRPLVSSRQTPVTESKEVLRVKNSVAAATMPAASAAKAASLTESTASTGANSAAAGVGVGATKDKGKAARDNGEGKKADGKAKVAADKNSTNSKAATESSSGDVKAAEPAVANGPVPFPLPELRHEHASAAEASATATAKALTAAAKAAAGDAAGGEKRGGNKAAPFAVPDKGGAATAKKAAAAATSTQISASGPASTASSSQPVAMASAAPSLPLPRSVKAAETDGTARAARISPTSGEQPHEVPLQQAWRDVSWGSAVSQVTLAAKTDGSGPVSASGPKQDVKSKPSAATAADEAEDSDVSYDLDRVLNFLRLKINYAAGVDDGDDDDQSSSTVSNADCRQNPTSFLHSDSLEHSTATPKRPLSNGTEVKCGVSAAGDLGVDANVSHLVPQRTDEAGAAQESYALAQPSGNESLTSTPQRVSQAIQSASEWTTTSRSGFGDCRVDSFACTNHNSANSSGNCALHGRRSSGFHVFSTHPNAAVATTAAGSSLSPHPRPVHMSVASHASELLPSEMVESGVELSAATRHMDFNAASSSLGHYQLAQMVAPPSPPLESRQSSSSHVPFSVSTNNPGGSQMSSMSSIGRANSDTADDRSSVLPRMRVAPNGRMSMSDQMATQKTQQSVSVADTMQQMQFAAPSMQQTMMMMMCAPDGQMALYPMVYNQPVYMTDANGMMQPAQSVKITSQPPAQQQQQQIVYAAAAPSPGQAVDVAYHIAPDGSYMMTAMPQMPQQMMSRYQQQQEPYQWF
ncbi:conserved hypothetical protein [Leishmania mexicana MHOM/GT/2001/U1103]|uniref:Uncharacterized protein n=1 Tax=Leishmania mexicana (strain MHOM/GT/2001/U1103) TaxID=929439 RepID=E9ATQ3_LEIMU|nr:conserved hypothetical protein [Leishmania mexicana MHOM/GT/2001/U1103]CBZ26328.1 conserved hypothetical protein [Leishmania mexicana MHOM/GT/2001/U1103]